MEVGMLASEEIIEMVARVIPKFELPKVVVDPVRLPRPLYHCAGLRIRS